MKSYINVYQLSDEDLKSIYILNAKHRYSMRSKNCLQIVECSTGPCVRILEIFHPDMEDWKEALNLNLKLTYREIFQVELDE
jgi:hypothetical protein